MRELVDETTFDCESNVVDYDIVPNDSYAYGVVNINDYLDGDDLIDIVYGALTKSEQINIFKKDLELDTKYATKFF